MSDEQKTTRLECNKCKKYVDVTTREERTLFLHEHGGCSERNPGLISAEKRDECESPESRLTNGRDLRTGHVMFNGIETDIRDLPISQESKAALFVTNENGLLPPPNDAPKELLDAYLVELNRQVLGENPIKRDPDHDQPYFSTEKIDNEDERRRLEDEAMNLAMLHELQQQPGFVAPHIGQKPEPTLNQLIEEVNIKFHHWQMQLVALRRQEELTVEFYKQYDSCRESLLRMVQKR